MISLSPYLKDLLPFGCRLEVWYNDIGEAELLKENNSKNIKRFLHKF